MLSGGQRQAIAIARALLYDPPILVMDEPTASIDPASERRLYQHLERVAKGKTLILITHRSAVLGLVNKLILMDKGVIVDYGERAAVMNKLQGRYYPNMEKRAKMAPPKKTAGNLLKENTEPNQGESDE